MIDFVAYVFVRLLNLIFMVLPVGFTLWLGRIFGIIVFWINKKRRVVAYANLKAAFASEKSPEELRAITLRVYQNMVQIFMEVLNLTKVNRSYVDKYVEVVNMDRIRRASESGRGTILLAAHFGDWELSSLVSSVEGYPIMVLVREQKMKRLNSLLNRLRESNGCKVIRKGMDVKNIIKSLRDNNIVGILADQDAGKKGVFVNFFGRPTSSHAGVMQIAKHTGSIILPNFIVRTHGPYHKLFLEEYIDFKDMSSPDDIKENLQKYMSLLEKYVRMYPDQWLWLHKRWKSTPVRTVLVLNDGKAGHLNQSLAIAGEIQRLRCLDGAGNNDTVIKVIDVAFKNKYSKSILNFMARFVTWRSQGNMSALRFCLEKSSYDKLEKTYCDFVVSCGSGGAGVNVFMSVENNAKNIVIMKPDMIGINKFSLAIVPRHDNPLSGNNVVRTVLAPNMIDADSLRREGQRLKENIKSESKITIGLLMGGDNPEFTLSREGMSKVCMGIIQFSKIYEAQFLVTTSRRTTKSSEEVIKDKLMPNRLCKFCVIANDKNVDGAVAGILDLSNIVIVSGESVSMISEAIASGKKVVVFSMEKKTPKITKYEKVLEHLAREGYITIARPAALGDILERVWKKSGSGKGVDDRDRIAAALRKLL